MPVQNLRIGLSSTAPGPDHTVMLSPDQIRASIERATRQAGEDLRSAGFDAKREITQNNQQSSSRKVILAGTTVYENFKPVCYEAAKRAMELKGSAAELGAVLRAKLILAREVYVDIAHQAAAFGSNTFAEQHWAKVDAKLKAWVEDILADFDTGVVSGVTPEKPTIVVNAQGGNALINAGAGTLTVQGPVSVSSIDVPALMQALQTLKSYIETSALDEALRQEGVDYVIDMTREAREHSPDLPRLQRYGAKVLDWSNRASAGAAGGVVAQGVLAALKAAGLA